MKGNERIQRFLELQDKNINIDDIAKEIGITTKTLKGFLNKNGYKLENGKYIPKEKKSSKKATKDSNSKKTKIKEEKESKVTNKKTKNDNKSPKNNKVAKEEKNVNKSKPKKDRKINLTQDDMDKLCEVYDWYLEVKDYKIMKPKKTKSKKDINVEEQNLKDLKNTSIRVDKSTWEDFERLCSNSEFSKQEIITQALKNFMKEYKHLL